jgi:hypothetical protein
MTSAAHDATEIPSSVKRRGFERIRARRHSHKPIARRQMWASVVTRLRSRDVLPPAVAQESVICTRGDRCAVGEHQSVGGFMRIPMSKHLRLGVAPIAAATRSPNDVVADFDIAKQFGSPIDQQDVGIA